MTVPLQADLSGVSRFVVLTPNLVTRFQRNIRRSIEIADQIAEVRVGGPSRQKLVRRFDGADFLGDGGGDPLIERNAVVPGQTRGGLLLMRPAGAAGIWSARIHALLAPMSR